MGPRDDASIHQTVAADAGVREVPHSVRVPESADGRFWPSRANENRKQPIFNGSLDTSPPRPPFSPECSLGRADLHPAGAGSASPAGDIKNQMSALVSYLGR